VPTIAADTGRARKKSSLTTSGRPGPPARRLYGRRMIPLPGQIAATNDVTDACCLDACLLRGSHRGPGPRAHADRARGAGLPSQTRQAERKSSGSQHDGSSPAGLSRNHPRELDPRGAQAFWHTAGQGPSGPDGTLAPVWPGSRLPS
jgi:hypothetical protein